MNTHLRSTNISLQFGDDVSIADQSVVNQLWQTFRRTAVEPGQSSSPDFTSFSDECLFCAKIVKNGPTATATNETRDSLFDTHPSDESTQDPPSSASLISNDPLSGSSGTIGLIYLHAGPANLPAGEANIGVIIHSDVQRCGHAREAVQLVLRWAFEELKFHRIQAAILDAPTKDRAMRLFIGTGFVHEGTKRRAVYQPEGEGMASIWKDVTHLAMLDTEWMLKSTWMGDNHAPEPPVASMWDELFARHAREREELLQWEERHGRTRRTSSSETLRERSRNAAQEIAYLTDDATSSVSESSPPSPRINVVSWEDDMHMADESGLDGPHQRWEEVVETSLAARRHRQWMGNSSLDPSMQGHILALPSIPSTRLSEGNPQSLLTIPSPSTSGATPPPLSASPSPAPSSVHSPWPDAEDEDNWLPRQEFTPTQAPIPFTTPHNAYPHAGPSSSRVRSRNSSVSSTGSWSDAQSSIDSNSWDVVSDASDHSSPGRA